MMGPKNQDFLPIITNPKENFVNKVNESSSKNAKIVLSKF